MLLLVYSHSGLILVGKCCRYPLSPPLDPQCFIRPVLWEPGARWCEIVLPWCWGRGGGQKKVGFLKDRDAIIRKQLSCLIPPPALFLASQCHQHSAIPSIAEGARCEAQPERLPLHPTALPPCPSPSPPPLFSPLPPSVPRAL